MRVIIAGAGIGGLATALMLHRRGIRAQVYEATAEVREVGVYVAEARGQHYEGRAVGGACG